MKHVQDSNAIYAKALQGIKFPATKHQLVECAKHNHADKHVLEVLQQMADDDVYQTMPDVFINTGEAKAKVNASHHRSKG